MSASITITDISLASDGVTLNGTLSGGTAPYSLSSGGSVAGFVVRTNGTPNVRYPITAASISGATIALTLGFPVGVGVADCVVDVDAIAGLTDAAGNWPTGQIAVEVANGSTVPVTAYSLSASGAVLGGVWSPGSFGGHNYRITTAFHSSISFRVNGSQAAVHVSGFNNPGAVQVTVDGGPSSDAIATQGLSLLPVLPPGAADANHDVTFSTTDNCFFDVDSTIFVVGTARTCTTPPAFVGTRYQVREAPFNTSAVFAAGVHKLDDFVGYPKLAKAYSIGARVAFNVVAATTGVTAWLYCVGQTIGVFADGAQVASNTLPNDGRYRWVSLASGLTFGGETTLTAKLLANPNASRYGILLYEVILVGGSLGAGTPAAPPPQLVTIGDSITFGAYASSPSLSYAARLATSLGYELANFGVSGETLASKVFDIPEVANLITPPARITVLIGVNDRNSGGTAADCRTNYAALATQLRAAWPTVPLTFFTLLPTSSGPTADFVTAELNGFADAAISNAQVVDTSAWGFGDGAGGASSTYFSDGLHPNDAGHARFATFALPYLLPPAPTDAPASYGVGRGFLIAS